MEDSFVAVADVQDVAPGNLKRVELDGHGYLIANVDGNFYAVDDLCSHEDFPLSYGCLEGADQPVATYPITIFDGRIWLNPGSAK
jgi:3-phenylpropionate/trans-cinnamate dioxygenase ferredoxin subunit